MNNQKGMATLLITTMLLSASLLFSLASYKNVFYQIKRAQNEVLARQAHWQAEGGLECAFALNKANSSVKASLQNYTICNSTDLLITANDISSNRTTIKSEYNNISYSVVYKDIESKPRTSGAIQARSNLKLIGDFDIYPDVTGVTVDNKHQCVSARYSDNVYYEKIAATAELEVFDPKDNGPYEGFSGQCLDTHKSNVTVIADTITSPPNSGSTIFKSDFVKDTGLKPFESFFGKKLSEINDVKKDFGKVTGSTLITGETCDKLIADAFKTNNKVWVTGNCDLLNAHLMNGLPDDNRVLVVENGILATYSSTEFSGVIYHLITTPIVDMTSAWAGIDSGNTMDAADKVKGVYYQAGSFVPDGGFIFDTPGGLTIIKGSIKFTFVGDRNPLPPSNDINWVKGSWHDF
ncbi:hypothetical protein L4D76_24805 [Photobacterium sagamiensis]|uniref:hypothetical protein n=1 Tax=Photobacterium sagamiensis TaxID=2910241 RepID=UPI003D149535